jgi:uncharacterized membrane protein
VLGLFVAGGVAEAVVFALRVVGGGVVEGCGVLVLAGFYCFTGCNWLAGWTYHCLRGA